jgi:hypothetical protein
MVTTSGLLAVDLSDPAEPWRTAQIGVSDAVPVPFEKLAVAGTKVKCWGREYALAAPLPVQITSQGEALLAGPMRLVVQQQGRPVTLSGDPVRLTATAGNRVEFVGEGQAEGLPVAVAGWLEYDGAMQVRLTVRPAAAVTLERLAIEIPLRPEIARLFHVSSQWGKYVYDRVGQEPGWQWNLDWQALLWVGDHHRGLTFITQTAANWTGPPDQALQLVRTPEAVIFRANLINEPTVLTAEQTWTLGLQATPGKPLPVGWHGRHVGGGGVAAAANAAQMRATGQNIAFLWHTECKSFSYPEAKDPQAMKAAVKAYHAAGMRVVIYITLSGTGPETPVLRRHWQEWLMGENGKSLFGQLFEAQEGEKTSYLTSTCPASTYTDWLVWAVDQAMAEYDLDGVYIDNAGPYYCSNDKHGCGGPEKRTYPYFANRALHQRLWQVVHGRKPDTGIVWEHSSRTSNSFNLTFVDIYSDGEHFRIKAKGTPEQITPALLEISGTGRQWGAQPCFLASALNAREQYTDWLLARLLPYGNMLMSSPTWMDFSRLDPVMRARLAFGLDKEAVEWITPEMRPGWLAVKPASLLVGAYLRSDRKLLVTISNTSEEKVAARLELPALSAKLGGPVIITDALTGRPCPPLRQTLVLSIPADSFRLVLVEPAE